MDKLAVLLGLRAYAEKVAHQAGYYLDHSRWHASGAGKGSTLWHHGTRHSFDQFSDPLDLTHSASMDWNAQLGVHFTNRPGVAGAFANGVYGDEAARKVEGRVISARLKIHTPAYYDREIPMKQDASRVALHAGLLDEALSRKDYTQERYFQEFRDREGLNNEQAMDLWAVNVYHDHMGHIAPMFEVPPRLAFHKQMARAFKDHLETQGHDGVVYENTREGGLGAIAFHPEQIEVAARKKARPA